jgi:hypothetical protein
MAKIFYLHWNQAEAEMQAAKIKKAGHKVHCHWSTEDHIKLGDFAPEVVVISLDRLPSHGRQVAEWFWEAKKRQVISIIFAGGKPEKVDVVRKKFPKAIYCESEEVVAALSRLKA